LTETWGTLPELVAVADAEALASSLAGVAAAWARAAEAAAIAIALFMVERSENMGSSQVKKNLLVWRFVVDCGIIQSESGGSSE
jgi:hypothetical protein